MKLNAKVKIKLDPSESAAASISFGPYELYSNASTNDELSGTPYTRDILREGPVWSARRQALFGVDIRGQKVSWVDLSTGEIEPWAIPERIGWIVEREGRDSFVAGLKSGSVVVSLMPFALEYVATPESDRPHNRLNDAKTDRSGRSWAGSMNDLIPALSGALYRPYPGFAYSRMDDFYLVASGPAFSPNGSIMYHTDTSKRIVYAFDLDVKRNVSGKRPFITFEVNWDYRDGMTVDEGLWIAHCGGGWVCTPSPCQTGM